MDYSLSSIGNQINNNNSSGNSNSGNFTTTNNTSSDKNYCHEFGKRLVDHEHFIRDEDIHPWIKYWETFFENMVRKLCFVGNNVPNISTTRRGSTSRSGSSSMNIILSTYRKLRYGYEFFREQIADLRTIVRNNQFPVPPPTKTVFYACQAALEENAHNWLLKSDELDLHRLYSEQAVRSIHRGITTPGKTSIRIISGGRNHDSGCGNTGSLKYLLDVLFTGAPIESHTLYKKKHCKSAMQNIVNIVAEKKARIDKIGVGNSIMFRCASWRCWIHPFETLNANWNDPLNVKWDNGFCNIYF